MSKIKRGPLKLTLSVSQRILLNSAIESWPPRTAGQYRKASRAMDITELSKDERREIKYRPLPNTNSMTWDETEREYVLEFKDREVAHTVRQAAQDLDMARWPRRNRVEVLDLWKQLDIYQDDDEPEEEAE